MVDYAQLPLETYLLAQYAAPIECLICNQENCLSSSRCRHCAAPMALAHQALTAKRPPRLLAVLGASGVGKTTYLGMLMDMLTRQASALRTVIRGPMSISLQQTTTTALSSGWFPEKTARDPEHWHWVHCQFHCRRRRRPLELVIPDMSGEALTEETEKGGRFPAIQSLFGKCAGVIVLADAEKLQSGDHSQDFLTMKMLSLLSELRQEQSHNRRQRALRRTPLALVLTKADTCDACLESPHEFAESHAGSLLKDCESRFSSVEVFASSVAGATAHRDNYGRRQHVPLRIEPRGIIEPFGWLTTEMN